MQQVASEAGLQTQLDTLAGSFGARLLALQGQLAAGLLGLPVRQLRVHVPAGQAFAPGFEGAGLARQLHCQAAGQLQAGALQVFQQHAPGHAIDHQVVDGQQQAIRLAWLGQVEAAQVRAAGRIEAALDSVVVRLRVFAGGQFYLLQQRAACFGGMHLLPLAIALLEAQAQGVVVLNQGLQGPLQLDCRQRLGQFQ